MSDGERQAQGQLVAGTTQAETTAAACHPDVSCPVCASQGKTVRMIPVKAHYQCPECRYFDSCCM